MKCMALITNDNDLITATKALIGRLKRWNLVVFDNVDAAWVSIYEGKIDLVVFDLDFTAERGRAYYERHEELALQGKMPPVVVISSKQLRSEHGIRATRMHAMDYIQKPVDFDRIVFAMNIAGGHEPRR